MPPTTEKIIEIRINDDNGVEEPGVYRVRLEFRDKLFVQDVSLRPGIFEKSAALLDRLLIEAKDVPGVKWGRNASANLEALGAARIIKVAVKIVEASSLTESDVKN